MDNSRYSAKHVASLPKSGVLDFFDIMTQMKDALAFLRVGERIHNPRFNCGKFAIVQWLAGFNLIKFSEIRP